MSENETLARVEATRRYELRDGAGELLGYVEYLPAGESTIVAHTEVPPEREGTGVGGRLVRATFEAIAAEGKTIMALCPFAAAYVQRHPELVPLLSPADQKRLGGVG